MSSNRKISKEEYQKLADKHEKKRPIVKNCMIAFFVGGTISLIGQVISFIYIYFFDFSEQTVGDPTVATLIFITMLLTGFGVYDKIAQFSGAGTAVPVTGFGNAVISAAIEHRTEGFVQGVGGNMFKLAGSVILFGVFSAFVIALTKTILIQMGVI
ncbi:stage V sporulation protein AC [Natronobacillus azotifigens]|uniref:Stage V sporulation protein AC n=1 Tax=Natronobacillus azotifigens TaxID=472978 RepID=A0A9J6REF9_9BACI|nr:stage V sporulation protein AC [Natronobacillus azotifigens]MCZ0703943.1 stage V sporulation protein AC [Natronobacillus azotifigens]